jgi:cell division protein FtsB
MSRRGRSGPTISLFSFQDIITSVTAIVTVITLLLALDLVQRKQSEASSSPAHLADELTKRLESAVAEAAQLQAAVSAADELVQDVAGVSPTELRNELAAREAEIERMTKERRRLETLTEKLAEELKQVRLEAFELETLRAETESLEREADELERQRTAEQVEGRAVFSLPRGFQKKGWLAVVETRTITLAPLGRPARPITLTSSNVPLLGNSSAQELIAWIDREQSRTIYILLLVRPGGERTLDEAERLLSERGISFGYDLICADETIMHPERGAAQ